MKRDWFPEIVKKMLLMVGLKSDQKVYLLFRGIYWKVATDRTFPFRSYGNYGEDAVLRAYLPETRGGFLDIGGGSPKSGSNTFFLYKRGWKGTVIDPLLRNQNLFRKQRPNDDFILGLVSSLNQPVPIYEYEDYQLSHSNEELHLKLRDRGLTPINLEYFDPIRISDLNLSVVAQDPFLLSIDVESHEKSVLDTIDWEIFQPRVICIEEWDFKVEKPSDIWHFMTSKSYILVSRAVTSNIYLHSDYLSTHNRLTQSHLR